MRDQEPAQARFRRSRRSSRVDSGPPRTIRVAFEIVAYEQRHEAAVTAFNTRLLARGADPGVTFPQHALPAWLPPGRERTTLNQYFLALDAGGDVRGAYALRALDVQTKVGLRKLHYLHHPVSEGIVDRRFASVGLALLRDAMRRTPSIFAYGMGGYDQPLPRLLVAMGWQHFAVRTFVCPVRAHSVLRSVPSLRATAPRRLLADIAAWSGAGGLALTARRAILAARYPHAPATAEPEESFGAWADEVWEHARSSWSFVARRDAQALNELYANGPFTRLRVRRGETTIGWAVLAPHTVRPHPQLGNLRVEWLLDCLAETGESRAVVRQAVRSAKGRGADAVLSTQSSAEWTSALAATGFVEVGANAIFAYPKTLEPDIGATAHPGTTHFVRADGDGLFQYFA